MGLGDEGLVLILALIDFLSPFFFFPSRQWQSEGMGAAAAMRRSPSE